MLQTPHKCGRCQSAEVLIDWHLSVGFLNTSSKQIKAQTTTARALCQPDSGLTTKPSADIMFLLTLLCLFERAVQVKKLHKSGCIACTMWHATSKLVPRQVAAMVKEIQRSLRFSVCNDCSYLSHKSLSVSRLGAHCSLSCNLQCGLRKSYGKTQLHEGSHHVTEKKHDFVGQEIWKPAKIFLWLNTLFQYVQKQFKKYSIQLQNGYCFSCNFLSYSYNNSSK